MLKTPLYTALLQHQNMGMSPFHMPGHKNAPGVLPSNLLTLDYTEIPGTDSLFEASGPILEAEKAASQAYGAKRTLFSAGGCTLCIQTMLYLAAGGGGKIIAGRVLHRSAVNTMALLDLEPVWILPRQDAGPGLAGRLAPEDIQTALKENPDAKAVYLTSPDYYGILSDIRSIAAICRSHRIPLLVDNAHGAHLKFLSQDLHPLSAGASMTACSAHKTLPVLTGGAWLNIADSVFIPHAKEAMAIFGSTSPSYPIMASLDLCRAWAEEQGQDAFVTLENTVARIRLLALAKGFTLPTGPCDPTRLTLNTASVGLSGVQAAEYFRRRGIEPEYADGAHVIMIPSPFNSNEDFRRLEAAISDFPLQRPLPLPEALPPLPPKACSPRQAVFSIQEKIPLKNAVGRIAAQAACPCPPGIPVVMPGEKITSEVSEFLHRYGFFSIKVIK